MPSIALFCVIAQFLVASVLLASEDSFAAPLFSHTKFELPEPYKNGEIVARGASKMSGKQRRSSSFFPSR